MSLTDNASRGKAQRRQLPPLLKSCYHAKNFPSIVPTMPIYYSPLSPQQGGRLRLTCPSGPKKQDLSKALLASAPPASLLSVGCAISDIPKSRNQTPGRPPRPRRSVESSHMALKQASETITDPLQGEIWNPMVDSDDY